MYLGIDFSGGAAPWRARCSRPSVWIAQLEDAEGAPRLADVRPVQALAGEGAPFDRLVALLQAGAFVAAGIDAPCSIPVEHLGEGGHAGLLARVAALPPAADRPFPGGAALVDLASAVAPLRQAKPLRATERLWAGRGINTRSTLWNGPRPGAPFTAACLTLLAQAGRPVWPWRYGPGVVVEAFPAAQLWTWGLPHRGYARPEQRDARAVIVAGLAQRLRVDAAQRELLLDQPDALDAVLAAFGAIAAAAAPMDDHPADGWIAVMEEPAMSTNMLTLPATAGEDELFEDLLRRPGIRIERIVSHGHTTPPDAPYVQDWDEWVLVVQGEAGLLLGGDERRLVAGDHLMIPAGTPHLVTYTADPTIWLAIHFDPV
jgi:cupin 2 domain-containing protein